jgi:hypothetical protein
MDAHSRPIRPTSRFKEVERLGAAWGTPCPSTTDMSSRPLVLSRHMLRPKPGTHKPSDIRDERERTESRGAGQH